MKMTWLNMKIRLDFYCQPKPSQFGQNRSAAVADARLPVVNPVKPEMPKDPKHIN